MYFAFFASGFLGKTCFSANFYLPCCFSVVFLFLDSTSVIFFGVLTHRFYFLLLYHFNKWLIKVGIIRCALVLSLVCFFICLGVLTSLLIKNKKQISELKKKVSLSRRADPVAIIILIFGERTRWSLYPNWKVCFLNFGGCISTIIRCIFLAILLIVSSSNPVG